MEKYEKLFEEYGIKLMFYTSNKDGNSILTLERHLPILMNKKLKAEDKKEELGKSVMKELLSKIGYCKIVDEALLNIKLETEFVQGKLPQKIKEKINFVYSERSSGLGVTSERFDLKMHIEHNKDFFEKEIEEINPGFSIQKIFDEKGAFENALMEIEKEVQNFCKKIIGLNLANLKNDLFLLVMKDFNLIEKERKKVLKSLTNKK